MMAPLGLMSKNGSDCPVAASLTDADRATLLSIKQEITSVAANTVVSEPRQFD